MHLIRDIKVDVLSIVWQTDARGLDFRCKDTYTQRQAIYSGLQNLYLARPELSTFVIPLLSQPEHRSSTPP